MGRWDRVKPRRHRPRPGGAWIVTRPDGTEEEYPDHRSAAADAAASRRLGWRRVRVRRLPVGRSVKRATDAAAADLLRAWSEKGGEDGGGK
jgi:hypothetical protein